MTSNNILEYLHPEVMPCKVIVGMGSLAFPHGQHSFQAMKDHSPTTGPTAIRLSVVGLSNCSLTQRKKEL